MLEVVLIKNPSHGFLLCVWVSLLWGAINSTTTLSPTSTNNPTTPSTSAIPTTPTRPPDNVRNVTIVTQSMTSITLEWEPVNNILTYTLQYENNGTVKENEVNASSAGTSVNHVVSPLDSGKRYAFTLITLFEGLNSSGLNFTAATTPRNTENVRVVTQNESSITLEWNKVNDILTYTLQYDNGTVIKDKVIAPSAGTSVNHVVSPLDSGKRYRFTLFTEFEGLNSSGLNFPGVTAPENVNDVTVLNQTESSVTIRWEKLNDIFTYVLRFNSSTSNIDHVKKKAIGSDTSITREVSKLEAGTKHHFKLFTIFERVYSSGFSFSAVTAPRNTENVTVVTQNESSITLEWNKVNDILTYTLQYDNGTVIKDKVNASSAETSVNHVVSPLNSGKRYVFTLFTEFEGLNSSGFSFTAATTPQNTENVTVVTQDERSITLEWNKVNNIPTYILQYENNGTVRKDKVKAPSAGTSVKHGVSPLNSGKKYEFTLFTEFEGLNSSGLNFTGVTAPENVKNVTVLNQTDSSVTIRWEKVNDISTYDLRPDTLNIYRGESKVIPSDTSITREVSKLEAGTKYHFKLFTIFERVYSSGFRFSAVTVPLAVKSINVSERSVNAVTLTWKPTNRAWAYFVLIDERHELVFTNSSSDLVSHDVTHLQSGTKYTFNVITTFSGLNSSAFQVVTVTAINCSLVNWHVSSTSIQGTVNGSFTSATASSNSSGTHNSTQAGIVSFTDLFPGASYQITLAYLDHNVSDKALTQCNHNLHLPPSSIENAHCDYWGSGYSIRVFWVAPIGLWTQVDVNVTGRNVHVSERDKHHAIIGGLQPAQTYEVSVGLRYETRMSERAFVFDCSTDPRGVITGSVMAVLLFLVLVCVAAFIFLKKPHLIRKKPFIGGSKLSKKKDTAVPITKFPDHFAHLSLDEDRGFGLEYESLSPVGTEQTQRVAELPDNKAKNRFTNVLPYDWNRVKLNKFSPNDKSDYINASYMPGYNSKREFIATQGPLPSTVNDFWRMIWEQNVRGIVMVTNCTERGKVKCEKYWPDSSQSLLYGELLVTHRSEQQDTNWTLREFSLKHKSTSEERTVKHFHFTAWPDHGVPEGTEVLIQFRELLRQHIAREATGAPTAVHCSAGVGRTGTIIALDVLLQQLQKERAVGVNALVHKMRLHRPHMVQTESQYVFLHQCIMDYLQPTQRSEEAIYENVDMIYVNATALKELR